MAGGGYGVGTSLGTFLETMYKKRALEYEAAYNNYKAKVAGAEAIGQGIGAVGKGIGSTLGTYVGAMQQRGQTEERGNIAGGIFRQEGINPVATTPSGLSQEFDMRAQLQKSQGQQGLTPYQQLLARQNDRRYDFDVSQANQRRQDALQQQATTANAQTTKSYQENLANINANLADTTNNMSKLYGAKTQEEFDQLARNQRTLNIAGAKLGIPPEELAQIPDKWIPPENYPAFKLYQAEDQMRNQFRQGTSRPEDIAEATRRYTQSQAAVEQTGATPSTARYGQGPGFISPPSYSSGVVKPPGAIAVPNFTGQKGDRAPFNGKMYEYDGIYMVPVK